LGSEFQSSKSQHWGYIEMMNVNSLENRTRIRGLIQYIGNPFIEAFVACLGCCGDSCVYAGWNPKGQLAGVRFVRRISKRGDLEA
jgi:hypothetical protein